MPDRKLGSIILESASKMEDMVVTSDIKSTVRRVIAEGTLQDLDVQNRNKRYYAKSDISRELNGDRWNELMKAGYARGEMSHPLSNDLVRQQTIDDKLTCVKYLKTWIDGDKVKAQFRGTNNEYGNAFDLDLRDGDLPAFSLRALGNIENVNGKAYVKHLRLITYDCVIFPSHKAAYTSGLVTESALVNPDSRLSKMAQRALRESAESCGVKNITDQSLELMAEQVSSMNEYGNIISVTGKDATEVLNKLQRESASIGMILETFEGIANDVKVVGNRIKLETAYGESMWLDLDRHVNNLIQDFVYNS